MGIRHCLIVAATVWAIEAMRLCTNFRSRTILGSLVNKRVTSFHKMHKGLNLYTSTGESIGVPAFNHSVRTNSVRLYSSSISESNSGGQDTIYALSSGPITKTGVAVIRISGQLSSLCMELLLRGSRTSVNMPKPRLASLRYLYIPCTEEVLDQSLVLWFPGPRSFTGEDVVELHVHGSRAVIQSVFAALEIIDKLALQAREETLHSQESTFIAAIAKLTTGVRGGIRPAERGEFTRRAFENGRMDLTEVEGLADLLDAETAVQRRQALRQMDGLLRKQYEEWRSVLITCLAHTEAVIDFGDDDREDDVDDNAMWALTPKVEKLRNELKTQLSDNRRGEIVREGVKIALAGPPNAGKSSLLNVLARRPAAIVSPIAGTTRDIVEIRLDLCGVPCIISDTAGLRDNSNDPIELEGIRRAREAFESAQLKIFVADSSGQKDFDEAMGMLRDILSNRSIEKQSTGKMILVLNKADIIDGAHNGTGSGIDQLEEQMNQIISSILNSDGGSGSEAESTIITRDRHRRHVRQCVYHLDSFLSKGLPMDAAAEELRLAALELGKVTGRIDVEELLDVIFRDFCIGK